MEFESRQPRFYRNNYPYQRGGRGGRGRSGRGQNGGRGEQPKEVSCHGCGCVMDYHVIKMCTDCKKLQEFVLFERDENDPLFDRLSRVFDIKITYDVSIQDSCVGRREVSTQRFPLIKNLLTNEDIDADGNISFVHNRKLCFYKKPNHVVKGGYEYNTFYRIKSAYVVKKDRNIDLSEDQ